MKVLDFICVLLLYAISCAVTIPVSSTGPPAGVVLYTGTGV